MPNFSANWLTDINSIFFVYRQTFPPISPTKILLFADTGKFWGKKTKRNQKDNGFSLFLKEWAAYMQLQEKQLSDFSPIHVEFCRFSDGSKLNSSPRCCQSFLTDGTKLSIFHERRIIVSCFFYYWCKIFSRKEFCKSFSVLLQVSVWWLAVFLWSR